MPPQDDLFRAVNGAWLAKTEIPADRPDYGVFGILAEKAEKDLREIIEGCAAAKDNAPGSERQKMGDLYASFMDEARAEQLGIEPIAGMLAAIDGIKSKADLVRTLAELAARSASPARWVATSAPTRRSRTGTFSICRQAGLGLPDRDYYWDAKFKDEAGGLRRPMSSAC